MALYELKISSSNEVINLISWDGATNYTPPSGTILVPLTGSATSSWTGSITGSIPVYSGNFYGKFKGPLSGSFNDYSGSLGWLDEWKYGTVKLLSGSFTGSLSGSLTGSLSGSLTGSLSGSGTGSFTGSFTGSLSGSLVGSFTGSAIADVTGSFTGSFTGSLEGSSSYAVTASYALSYSGTSGTSGTSGDRGFYAKMLYTSASYDTSTDPGSTYFKLNQSWYNHYTETTEIAVSSTAYEKNIRPALFAISASSLINSLISIQRTSATYGGQNYQFKVNGPALSVDSGTWYRIPVDQIQPPVNLGGIPGNPNMMEDEPCYFDFSFGGGDGTTGPSGSSGSSGTSGTSGTGFNTINNAGVGRVLLSDGTDNAATASTIIVIHDGGIIISGSIYHSGSFFSSGSISGSGTGSWIGSITGSLTGSLTGSVSGSETISFITTANQTVREGEMTWNDGDGTLDLGLKGGNVTLSVGEQTFARVYNGEATTLNKGEVVYISGSQGNRIKVKRADYSAEAGSSNTLGFVAETITSGAEGFVVTNGVLGKLNTVGLTEGSLLYLSSSGQYTTTKTVAPQHTVILGYLERVHATVGSIYVKIDNGYELGELHNVLTNGVTNGDILAYNGSVWTHTKQISGSFTGSLQGSASYAVSASYVIGGGGASVTNPGNNYVITSDGTTGGLVGENRLLFDGSNLSVSGSILMSGSIANPNLYGYTETFVSSSVSSYAGGLLNPNLTISNIYKLTLDSAVTQLNPTNAPMTGTAGSLVLILVGDGTPRSVSWGPYVTWSQGSAPGVVSGSGRQDIYSFITYNGGTNWYGFINIQNTSPLT